MMENVFFSEPRLLWAIPIIVVAGLFALKKSKRKMMILSRVIIFCLLAVALANPYVVTTQTTQAKKPLIAVVSDETASMEIFDQNLAERVHDQLAGSQFRSFTGMSTPLGDKILQYAQQGGTLVLVTDGYNNRGQDLEEALGLVTSANSTVFAIEAEPVLKDASVEISGTNTAVLGGDYPLTAIVRWSGEEFEGTLSVYADNEKIYEDRIAREGRSTSIKMSHNFKSTGSHVLKATISSQGDFQRENNEYLKAVYVVPKPDVLLVTKDDGSPLATVLSDQYKLTTSSDIKSDLEKYKVVILDDQEYDSEMQRLKNYVREGGGLVVVGGPDSYDFGEYRNTSIEEILPVISIPSLFKGGKTTVIVMDISGSTRREMSVGGATFLEYEKSLALEILKSPEFQDDQVGLAVFGTEAFVVFPPTPIAGKQAMIEDRISRLQPQPGVQIETQLDTGLQIAWDMLNATGGEGEMIVISDGRVKEYPEVFEISTEIIVNMETSTHLVEVKSFEDAPGGFRELAQKTGANYHLAVYPNSVTIRAEERPEEEEAPKEEETLPEEGYGLQILDPNHYITSELGLNANLTGFNDVTPKPGSQRLVSMPDGKPILTVWRFGLGRVVSLTTDNGDAWSPEIYAAFNSLLVSRTANWAVGDPRPRLGRIDAEDGWVETPLDITITSQNPPQIGSAQMEKVGEDRYKATIIPDKEGIYHIGDYKIAVNYPLEFRYVGLNPEFSKMIMAKGGKVFTESEVRGNLIEEARKKSEITVQKRVSRRGILLFAALALFLSELILRRLKEVRG